MVGEEKISSNEAIVLTVIFISTKVFLIMPAVMADLGASAGWMIIIVATVTALIGFLPLAALLEKFPGKSIIEIGEELVGPVINTLFSLVYLALFLAITSLVLRQFSERVLTAFIPEMPLSVSAIILLGGMIVAGYLGIAVIGRVTMLVLLFLIVALAIMLLLPYPFWEVDYLFPFWGSGIKRILESGLLKSSIFGEVFILALISPSLNNTDVRKIGLWSIAISGLVMVIVEIIFLMVFSMPVASEITLPIYQMNSLIYLGRFVQRLEVIFIPLWYLVALLKLSIGLYGIVVIVTRMLRLPYHQPLVFPLSIIVVALAFWPPNVAATIQPSQDVIGNYSWAPVFVLPGILFLLYKLRKEKRPKNAAQNSIS